MKKNFNQLSAPTYQVAEGKSSQKETLSPDQGYKCHQILKQFPIDFTGREVVSALVAILQMASWLLHFSKNVSSQLDCQLLPQEPGSSKLGVMTTL